MGLRSGLTIDQKRIDRIRDRLGLNQNVRKFPEVGTGSEPVWTVDPQLCNNYVAIGHPLASTFRAWQFIKTKNLVSEKTRIQAHQFQVTDPGTGVGVNLDIGIGIWEVTYDALGKLALTLVPGSFVRFLGATPGFFLPTELGFQAILPAPISIDRQKSYAHGISAMADIAGSTILASYGRGLVLEVPTAHYAYPPPQRFEWDGRPGSTIGLSTIPALSVLSIPFDGINLFNQPAAPRAWY